jgi:hypothetical protein
MTLTEFKKVMIAIDPDCDRTTYYWNIWNDSLRFGAKTNQPVSFTDFLNQKINGEI